MLALLHQRKRLDVEDTDLNEFGVSAKDTDHEGVELEESLAAVPASLAPAVDAAWGMAMSVEHQGGSPAGLPTGPALYKRPCTKL